jgi:tRNA 2-thiouridine synthesizing protein A
MAGPPVDIRALACPLTWVKARLALERAVPGQRVEVWLREGEPLASVPRSAAEEGHRVVAIEPLAAAGEFRVVLEKCAPLAAELP